MIEINSGKSYLGKEIREWCMSEFEDTHALEIRKNYYSDKAEYKPSDRVYYFVEHVSYGESYKECGSLYMEGIRLVRDLDKSPRRTDVTRNHEIKKPHVRVPQTVSAEGVEIKNNHYVVTFYNGKTVFTTCSNEEEAEILGKAVMIKNRLPREVKSIQKVSSIFDLINTDFIA